MDEDKDVQAFIELQRRLITQMDTINSITLKERARTTTKQKLELTKAELVELPDDTNMYRTVGKAYFFMPKASVLSDIQDTVSTAETELAALKQQKEVLEKKAKETEAELRELVQTHPSLAGARPRAAAAQS